MADRKKYSYETSRQAFDDVVRRNQELDDMKYESKYGDSINATLGDVARGRKFEYEGASDPTYQYAKRQYENSGAKAMRDTQAQSAALTGGYGNSFGQVAGQSVYNDYMSKAAGLLPEFEETAYKRHQNEQNERYNYLNALLGLDSTDYGRFSDDVSRRQNGVNNAMGLYDALYSGEIDSRNFDYQRQRDSVGDNQWERQFGYQQQRDSVGDNQWERQFAASRTSGTSSGSSGTSRTSSSGGTGSSETDVKKMQSGDKKYFQSEMSGLTNSVDLYNYAADLLKRGYSDADVESLLVQAGVRNPAMFMYTAGKVQSYGVPGMNYSSNQSTVHDNRR